MLSRISPLILLLLPAFTGCIAQAESAPEEQAPAAESSDTPPPPPSDPYAPGDGFRDPCVAGQVFVLNGESVWVPIPCQRETIDKGDPPPLEQRPGDPSIVEQKATSY
jgi:hypothetical protein